MKQILEKAEEFLKFHFDEQFPGPFADVSCDELGPVVVFNYPAQEDCPPSNNDPQW
jgi:hypothetical protein